jgi:hypothetical protein
VEVERVVLTRLVHEVPDLQLVDPHRLVALVKAAVHERLHADGASGLGAIRDERRDPPQHVRNLGAGGS